MASPLQIKIINHSGNPLPEYATSGSSGVDLKADLSEAIIISPMERVLIPTGIFLEIPQSYEGQVRTRSGMALKYGLICLNSPGTIDADYRGEVKVILVNLSTENQVIHPGDRIAQLVFAKVELIQWIETTQMSETARGEGGFGHTGKN
ncbi:MAG: dUTP diphosphatase [Bacteroidetes bacterium]|nr:dUTP diphosphatase [Bacteroidota bacterium]